MFEELHVSRYGQNVHEVKEDCHYHNNHQVYQGLDGNVPHLPVFPRQVRVIGLVGCQRATLFIWKIIKPSFHSVNLGADLNVELVECHDGSEVKEGEVKVVLEKLQDAVVSIFSLTVLKSKTHTAHDGETTAAVEQKRTELKIASRKPCLKDEPFQMNNHNHVARKNK